MADHTPVLIVGAGGHARVVLDLLRRVGRYEPAGFIDADPAMANTLIAGLKVFGAFNQLPHVVRLGIKHAIVAIGDNRTRAGYAQKLAGAGVECIQAIHPAAVISDTAQIGRNVVICAGAIVGPDAVIGDSVLINHGAIVEHECSIGQAAHIAPGAKLAGRVRVGDFAFIGLGASVIQCLQIGEGAVIGAGAVVIRDVAPQTTVVGVPALPMRRA